MPIRSVTRSNTTELITYVLDRKVRIERINGSKHFSARVFIQGKAKRKSTKTDDLDKAKKVAEEWYFDLRHREKNGEQIHGRLFGDAVKAFLAHVEERREVSLGQRRNYRQKWSLLRSSFKDIRVNDIDAEFLHKLRARRSKATTKDGNPVKPATIKKDLLFVRLVLRHSKEYLGWVKDIPQFPAFRGDEWAIVDDPQPTLTPDEYAALLTLANERYKEPGLNARTREQRLELLAFVMICTEAALRVDEALDLRWEHCRLIRLRDDAKSPCVKMVVRGKHSRGRAKSELGWGLHGAVVAFQQLKKSRPEAKPQDKLFREGHADAFRELLIAGGLRFDAEGRKRNAKSLRVTGICLRLYAVKTPDYRAIAKWARTSPEMIMRYYDQTNPEHSVETLTANPLKKAKPQPSVTPEQAIERAMKEMDELPDPDDVEAIIDSESGKIVTSEE